jgi:hypothetical protein
MARGLVKNLKRGARPGARARGRRPPSQAQARDNIYIGFRKSDFEFVCGLHVPSVKMGSKAHKIPILLHRVNIKLN